MVKEYLYVLPAFLIRPNTFNRLISLDIFPVLNNEDELVGIVLLDNIREVMFQREKYEETLVSDVMISPPEIVDVTDNMDIVMKKFNSSGAWNLPVMKEGKYVGFVSKSKIFNTYRDVLVQVSEY